MFPMDRTTFLLGLFLGAVPAAFGRGKYVVDKKSCGSSFDHVKEATEEAIRWANQASRVLRKISEPNEDILKTVRYILPDDATIKVVERRLWNVGTFKYVDDSYDGKDLDFEDLVITCNGDHIKKRNAGRELEAAVKSSDPAMTKAQKRQKKKEIQASIKEEPYRDLITRIELPKKDSLVAMKYGKIAVKETAAITEWDWVKKEHPGSIYLHQDYISFLKKLKPPFPQLGAQKLEKAVDMEEGKDNDEKKKFQLKYPFWKKKKNRDYTPADYASQDVLVHTILHEFHHLPLSAQPVAEDIPEDACYLWIECVKSKEKNNAETIALVGFIAEIVLKYGYNIKEDGTVFKIPETSTSQKI